MKGFEMTAQQLYEKTLENIRQSRGLHQVTHEAGDRMYLYHQGMLRVYEEFAKTLVIDFDCKAVEPKVGD